jgi:hypothetical protein
MCIFEQIATPRRAGLGIALDVRMVVSSIYWEEYSMAPSVKAYHIRS